MSDINKVLGLFRR